MKVAAYNTNIYRLGEEYKVVYMRKTISDETLRVYSHRNDKIGDKFQSSISRARSKVLGYALCNDWNYFTTFTLDKNKYDRYDLDKWKKDFSQYIRDTRKSTGLDIPYLLIPELHQDGAWHMHGLMSGFDWYNDLVLFDPSRHPIKLVKLGYRYYPPILNKFGYNSFGKVKNSAAVSRYILKYIAKGIPDTMMSKGSHLYYCSNGLNKPELIDSGLAPCLLTDIDYQNDFLASAWIGKAEADRVRGYLL